MRLPALPRATGALSAGISAAKYAWATPGQNEVLGEYAKRIAHYNLMWGAFENYAFGDPQATFFWDSYKEKNGLYKHTKLIYNPKRRLVDFYASHTYPGPLSPDGNPLPNNKAIAIPLSADTPKELKAAIAQTWEWSNWQMNKTLWITYAAALGDGPVEIIDDVHRGKVYAKVLWPGEITEVLFDDPGNVTSYTKERHYRDENDGIQYKMTKIVNKKKILTFRNDEPYRYGGLPAEYDNPYGFVPLVWAKHRDFGTLPGSPAIIHWGKIEQLNSQVAQINSYIRKQAVSPQMLSGVGVIEPASFNVDGKRIDPDDLFLLVTEKAGHVQSLQGNLNIEAARAQIEMQLREIEADHPEIVMYHMLRGMTQVTGPAAQRLMGDVRGKMRMAIEGYDNASISLFRMMVAIAGFRLKEAKGGWANPTSKQKKFQGYDLESYQKDLLSFSIDERELVPETDLEKGLADQARYTAARLGAEARFPVDFQLHTEGWTDEALQVLHAYRENEAEQIKNLQIIGTPPEPVKPPTAVEPKPMVVPQGASVETWVPPGYNGMVGRALTDDNESDINQVDVTDLEENEEPPKDIPDALKSSQSKSPPKPSELGPTIVTFEKREAAKKLITKKQQLLPKGKGKGEDPVSPPSVEP